MLKKSKLGLFLLILFIVPTMAAGITMEKAMDEIAEYFVKSALKIEAGEELHVLEIVNYSNQSHDEVGKRLETQLYFALERQFPDFKLFLGKGQNKDKEIYLSGTYEQQAGTTTVRLRITRGNEVIAQIAKQYEAKVARRALVAVLDLEAETMNEVQKKAFSDIFRAALNELDVFDIASSADIDKMNPDEIQKATGCTRDRCATIIGEQLGVDRTVSSSLFKVSEELYILSAKILDIKDGSILVSRTVEHNGNLGSFTKALREMANKLVVSPSDVKAAKAPPAPPRVAPPVLAEIPAEEPIKPVEEEIETADSGISWWVWVAGGLLIAGLAAAAGGSSDSGGSSSGGGSTPDQCDTQDCGSVGISW